MTGWRWHSIVSALAALATILLGGHFLSQMLRDFVDKELAYELPGVAFAAFPPLNRGFEYAFSNFSRTAPKKELLGQHYWVTTGLSTGALMIAFSQFMGLLIAVGLELSDAVLSSAGGNAQDAVAGLFLVRAGDIVVAMTPIFVVMWVYFGRRIYATTRSHAVMALLLGLVSFAGFTIIFDMMVGDVRSLLMSFMDNKIALVSALSLWIVLPLIGLSAGAIWGHWTDAKRARAIGLLLRRMPEEKRDAVYRFALQQSGAHAPAATDPAAAAGADAGAAV
jgi:hypothetical protein